MSIASQIPQNLKPLFALNILPLHKSHSINDFAPNGLQKSDKKGREKTEQLDPITIIFDTNSINHHKFLKSSAKVHIPSMITTTPKIPRFLPKTNSKFIRQIVTRITQSPKCYELELQHTNKGTSHRL